MAMMNENDVLKEVVAKGAAYIKKNQGIEGEWTDFFSQAAGYSNQWVTGYVGHNLTRVEWVLKRDWGYLDVAADWLIKTEKPGGGWGYKKEYFADADSTANVIRLLVARPEREVKEYLLERGDFLLTFQCGETGGMRTYRPLPIFLGKTYMSTLSGWCQPEPSVSAMAGLALSGLDRERYQESLERLKNFILTRRNPEGFWESYWWDARMYGTAICCEFLETMEEHDAVTKTVQWILSAQFSSGGWGNGYGSHPDAFNTALALSVLRNAPTDIARHGAARRGIAWLTNQQAEDGSWTTAADVREPEPFVFAPWLPEQRLQTPVVRDQNRLFTSATAIAALARYIQNS